MSGVVKGIKKIFRKVVEVVKKIAVPLAIAIAAYFTAGVALSFFGPTAGFAASMPGFAGGGFIGTGLGAGATAGTGIFSQAAGALGLGSGLAQGALAKGTELAAVEAAVGTKAAMAGMAANTLPAGAVTGGATTSMAAGGGVAVTGGTTAASSLPGMGSAVATAGMSLTDKVLLTKIGTDVAGALFGPSAKEIAEMEAIESAKFRGAFYGMEADGPAPPEIGQQAPVQGAQNVAAPQPAGDIAITPEQQQLLDGRATREELFPTAMQPQVAQGVGPGQMQTNIPLPESMLGASSMAGVRYI